ncbi:nucleotide-binding oligomerization domain-containing protein 2-like [Amphiura filiformis]|uniref:nucleotide-binding oligomerization domain-containing protein 2-like n=1 Tax=Amphiura filiformis TaxID=82378 RepID=UPI003B20F34D
MSTKTIDDDIKTVKCPPPYDALLALQEWTAKENRNLLQDEAAELRHAIEKSREEMVARINKVVHSEAELTRQKTHDEAEATREKTHEEAEATREKTHEEAEATREKTHEEAEATREKTHEEAEATREKTHEEAEATREKTHEEAEATREKTHEEAEATREKTHEEAEATREKTHEEAEATREKTHEEAEATREKTHEEAEATREKTHEEAEATREKTHEEAEATREKTHEEAEATREKTHEEAEATREKTHEEAEITRETIQGALNQAVEKLIAERKTDRGSAMNEEATGGAAVQHHSSTDITIPITDKMFVKELKSLASKRQVDITGCLEKSELVATLRNAQQKSLPQQAPVSDNFDLAACQKELREFYLDTMGKVQLLPWVPEEVKEMESIFVDLELVRKDPSTESDNLKRNEDLVTFTSIKGQRVNRVLLLGDAGSGKSTTAANLAYKWALNDNRSPLYKFTLVFVIYMHKIEDSNASLVDLIFDQILAEDSQISREGLKSYITSNAKNVLLLLDGLDECHSGSHKNRSSEISKVLQNNLLRDSCVILTSRPHEISDLGEHLSHYTQVKLKGFSLENMLKYIMKFFREKNKIATLIQKLEQEPHILALAAIPVLLLMICILWDDNSSLPNTMTQLYQETIKHL